MSRIIKIKENHVFRRAYSRGKALVCPYVVVYVLKNRGGNIRLGITASKKIGKAVARNRARRVITAAFSNCYSKIVPGYDFIIVARTRILSVKSTVVEASLLKLLRSAGIYNDEQVID